MQNYWKFNEINHIEELSFNKVLERFYDFGVEGLVRENIQNSLDGKLRTNQNPVIVKIELGVMPLQDIPGIDEIFKRIKSLKGHNQYTKETIEYMNKVVMKYGRNIPYISFEDINTKGLSGAMKGQNGNTSDTWGAYAYSKGVHFTDSDDDHEKTRGGSHGIGKIASNAASDLYMMYFANCDDKGNQHLGGTIQLIEHSYAGYNYRATGYFTETIDNKYYPYNNNFSEVFKKDTRGLKIVIPFFREQFYDIKSIVRAVCDSFFVAILEKKLVVEVNDLIIDHETIENYICSLEYYEQNIEENKNDFTPLYYNTYLNIEPLEIDIKDLLNDSYKFKLYFNYDRRIQRGRVGIIRTIGMKIEDKKIPGNVSKPFNAVMMPLTVKEDQLIKSLENESHTEMSHEHIKDQFTQRNAKKIISNINKKISEIIEQHIREANPTDGFIDTEDILYEIENNFRKDLAGSSTNLTVNSGNKEKTVVKVKSHEKKKPKEPSGDDIEKKEKSTKKVTKKLNGDSKRDYFRIKPNHVKRAVVGNAERLRIDLSEEENLKDITRCDIYYTVIDGMGRELSDELNLKQAYEKIKDYGTSQDIDIDDISLKNVIVKDGIIDLEMKTGQDFNNTLKFAYYLEV